MEVFDPRTYWESRLAETYSLEGVGWAGKGRAYNAWMYRVRRRVFLREARDLPGSLVGRDVLDVGSGTGFYVDRWHELGVRSVTGSDIAQTAVGRLRERHPGDTFVRVDIGEPSLGFDRQFDAVSAMEVLFHIVDDERFQRALVNIHGLVRPGGHFLYSDNFLHGRTQRIRHQVSRSLEDITRGLESAGFEVVKRVPTFVILNNPVDSTGRLARWWWTGLSVATARGEAVGRLLGAALYPIELGLVNLLREGPSTELMVCRRPAETSTGA
jgi:SAM-dependent methyltransferase